ncbi:hypothetical protein, partial [Streptobacillus moniliformis]|uniref:hypothetical protein n=1 Tax=Streptobacillus moniliformis TaxID=34105 RepID=UPI0009BF5ECB
MKKIILVLLIGITSFSAPITRQINRRVNEVKKVEEIKEVKPKRIFKIKKPRYRVGMEISTLPIYHTKTKMFGYYAYKSFSFLPEWKIDVTRDFDVTIGPKFSANLVFGVNNRNRSDYTQFVIDKDEIIVSASVGEEVDFNYRLRDNLKAYIGLEAQVGIGERIYTKSGLYDTGKKIEGSSENAFKPYTPYIIFNNTHIMYSGKVSVGSKVMDKYN